MRSLFKKPLPFLRYLGGDRPPPRGLGRATATTSAAFRPHLKQRIRSASLHSFTFQSSCFGLLTRLATPPLLRGHLEHQVEPDLVAEA
jgi:hypothetical protein